MHLKKSNIWPQIWTTQTGHYFIFKLLAVIFTFKILIMFFLNKTFGENNLDGLTNDKRSILKIFLLLINGCSHQVVAISWLNTFLIFFLWLKKLINSILSQNWLQICNIQGEKNETKSTCFNTDLSNLSKVWSTT